jgi:hypothetical protein
MFKQVFSKDVLAEPMKQLHQLVRDCSGAVVGFRYALRTHTGIHGRSMENATLSVEMFPHKCWALWNHQLSEIVSGLPQYPAYIAEHAETLSTEEKDKYKKQYSIIKKVRYLHLKRQ